MVTREMTSWPTRSLGELLDPNRTVRYGIVQPGKYDDAGTIMLRSQDYSKGWITADDAYRVSVLIASTYRNAALRSGDLIMTIVGAGIGQIETAPEWLDGAVLSRSTARIAVNEKVADRRFIRACLESRLTQEQIWNSVKEGAQPVVSCRDLANFTLPFPPIQEQRAIGLALSDVDELIGALDKLIAKKRAIKLATMQQLLTGKTRLPGFIGAWTTVQVHEFGQVVTGGTPPTAVGAFWGEGFPWVTPTDISSQRCIETTERSITRAGLEALRPLPANTVLVTCIASIGKNAVLRTTGACNQQINAVIPNADHDPDFLYYLFEASAGYLKSKAGTTATSILSKASFAAFEFLVPSKQEQAAIGTVLVDMDAEIAALEQRRDKTKAIKQGMMQSLLTGRVRLVEPEGTP